MRKRIFAIIMTAAMAGTAALSGCGAEASEVIIPSVIAYPNLETEEEEAAGPYDTDIVIEAEETFTAPADENPVPAEKPEEGTAGAGYVIGTFFSDTVRTYYKEAQDVADIVSGLEDVTFAEGAASPGDIASGITADADLVTAVTYDASGVDFDTEGEYGVVYRLFVSTEALQEYSEAHPDAVIYTGGTGEADEPFVSSPEYDIDSDYIDICIPGTVTITAAEDTEADDAAEASEDADADAGIDAVTVTEVNEMTWTFDEAASIPAVITGIGGITYEEAGDADAEAGDADIRAVVPEFTADVETADAVLYDEGGVDEDAPDGDDVAYYAYFDREALLAYMEEAGIDPADYPGLAEAYTEHIMVYYGPLTELDLAGLIEGIEDRFVLEGAEGVDYAYGVTYDDTVITGVTVDDSRVDVSTSGIYPVTYTVSYETDVRAGKVGIDRTVEVVTAERAAELTAQGETVWTDNNAEYGTETETAQADTTRVAAQTQDTAVESAAAAEDSTDVYQGTSDNGTAGSGSSGSSSGNGTGSTGSGSGSSGSPGSSSSGGTSSGSGSGSSGSSGSSSGSSGSSGSGSSGSPSGSSETEHVHTWVEEYHPEQGHTESVLVSAAYDEQVKVGSAYFCYYCGFSTYDVDEIIEHILTGGPDGGFCGKGSYYTGYVYETVYHDPVYEDRYVVDVPAYTTYTCSGCGATK